MSIQLIFSRTDASYDNYEIPNVEQIPEFSSQSKEIATAILKAHEQFFPGDFQNICDSLYSFKRNIQTLQQTMSQLQDAKEHRCRDIGLGLVKTIFLIGFVVSAVFGFHAAGIAALTTTSLVWFPLVVAGAIITLLVYVKLCNAFSDSNRGGCATLVFGSLFPLTDGLFKVKNLTTETNGNESAVNYTFTKLKKFDQSSQKRLLELINCLSGDRFAERHKNFTTASTEIRTMFAYIEALKQMAPQPGPSLVPATQIP